MQKYALLMICLLLTACAPKYPHVAHLDFELPAGSVKPYQDTTAATMRARDARTSEEIVVYRLKDDPPVQIDNDKAPHVLVSERLVEGFQHQGLQFDGASSVRLLLDIDELVATVTRPKVMYVTEAISGITLTIDNRGNTFTKKYKREANRQSVSRPDLADLEKLLNAQLTDIVGQILQDDSVRNMIAGGSQN